MSPGDQNSNRHAGANCDRGGGPESGQPSDEAGRRERATWLEAQREAFRAAMNSLPLEISLGHLVHTLVGNAADRRRCAFYIADRGGRHLRHIVGMSESYARAVNGFVISPESLACGLAVATGKPVITPDVEKDERWRDWIWLARDHGFRCCWSFPIETATGRLVGSFALYFREPREMQPCDHELAAAMTQTAAIIISRHQENEERGRAEAGLRETEERLHTVLDGINESFYALTRDERFLFASQSALQLWEMSTADVLGHTFLEVFPHAFGSEAYDAQCRVMQTRAAERLQTISPIIKRWVEMDLSPTSRGGLSVAFRDIEARKQAERRQAFLLRLSDALRPLAESAEMERTAMRVLGKELAVNRAFFATIEPDGESWSIRHDFADGVSSLTGRHPMSEFQRKRLPTWQAGGISTVADSETDPTFSSADRAAYAAFETRAAISVPLIKGGRFAALLSVNQTEPREWTPDDLALTLEAAERIWAEIERVRTEAALREREADLARVQRIGGVGGLDIDIASGMTSRRSPEFLRLHGLPLDTGQETHADWRARVHPDDVEGVERVLFAALHGEAQSYDAEYRIIRPSDGETRWIEARADIERDVRGKPIRLVGAHIDITDQKRVQEALRESEERLRQFGEASQDVLWIRDTGTMEWTYLTSAFEEIYGLSRDEALHGDNFRNWLELIVPEDRQHARSMIDRVIAGEPLRFEYRVRRPRDGEIRWLRDTDFPIRNEHGRVASFGGIGQDVTAVKAAEELLRTSEERLRSAAEVARLALWDWNIRTGEIVWSDEHFLMEGYAVGEVTPSYEAWAARVHPDDLPDTELAIARARDTHTEYIREFRSLHPDGSVHWISARGRFFYDQAENPIRMVGSMTDTTERREWEGRQKVLVAELQHRTRNLMGVVSSMAEKTGETSLDFDDFRTRFRDRLQPLARAQSLLSRLGGTDRVAFDELLETELAAMKGTSEHITLEGPRGIRLRSSMVQTLAMALHELATNAVKYGAIGQPQAHLAIRWEMRCSDQRGQPWLFIDWQESGVRMPPVNSAPQGTGQGRELIEKALPYQLRAKTTFELGIDGVRCTLLIPVSASHPEPHHA
jgi:PAS domain S-box-containing protein